MFKKILLASLILSFQIQSYASIRGTATLAAGVFIGALLPTKYQLQVQESFQKGVRLLQTRLEKIKQELEEKSRLEQEESSNVVQLGQELVEQQQSAA